MAFSLHFNSFIDTTFQLKLLHIRYVLNTTLLELKLLFPLLELASLKAYLYHRSERKEHRKTHSYSQWQSYVMPYRR